MAGRAQRAFPVGLYGLLLGALCWLAVPELTAPLERAALGLVGFSVLADAELCGSEVRAATAADTAAVASLCQKLDERLRCAAEAGARALMPGFEPVLCRAVAVGHSRSDPTPQPRGGGLPGEVQLEYSYAELHGCARLVTWGESLVGFLCTPGEGAAWQDRPADRARVVLLNHPQAPSLPASMAAGEAVPLRCLVDAAAAVDPAPLRTLLWDDPYRASQLVRSGEEVRTLALARPTPTSVPFDLLLGHARVWGYEREGVTLPIGVYVEPDVDFRALSHVVLWSQQGRDVPVPASHRLVPAQLWPLPGSDGHRFHLRAAAVVPDGAAVVRSGICIGTARALAFGQATVTSFVLTARPWSLLLLPDDPALPPRELYAHVTPGTGNEAWLRCRTGEHTGAGYLFTGGNGPHCPAGLLLGRAEPQPEPGLMRVWLADAGGPAAVVVSGPAGDG
jgi:hypothetical protein